MKKNKILSPINRYGKNKEKINMEQYRIEIQKDVWDVRNLGIPYNTTRSDFYLSFEKIEYNFREIVKKYVQERLFVQDSIKFSTARSDVFTLIPFIKFITLKYPNWIDFNVLTRNDMEEYFKSLKSTKITGNRGKLGQAK